MQNFKNHVRYFPLHHFVLSPLTLIGLIISIVLLFSDRSLTEKIFFVVIAFSVFLTSLIARMYATKNQDRTIRAEMRLRYYILTGKRLETIEDKLTMGQIVALRFASDEELPALIEKTTKENLSPKAIKENIKKWVADNNRV
jgi:hypothetical protein